MLPVCLFWGCGNNEDAPIPTAAILNLPAQNSVCTTGSVISTTESTVAFVWNASASTESYELNIKNLLTGAVNAKVSNTNQLDVTLARNTPYSWYVVSKSGSTSATAKSEVWKFYNSGVSEISHPPFPADITAPLYGQIVTANAGTINLIWVGSDVDKDITSYDIYFDESATPQLIKSNITDTFLNNVVVTSGATYHWKVVTKDSKGNTSESTLYQFKVN